MPNNDHEYSFHLGSVEIHVTRRQIKRYSYQFMILILLVLTIILCLITGLAFVFLGWEYALTSGSPLGDILLNGGIFCLGLFLLLSAFIFIPYWMLNTYFEGNN